MSGIGIFGGTFDPVHCGHLRSAWEVTQSLALDTLYFVPNAQTVHRDQPKASFEHRSAMLQMAIAGTAQWQVSLCEGERSGASYSYHTVRYFRQLVGEGVPIWFILGSDAYRHFHTWHRWQDILQLCHLAVMRRAGAVVVGGCEETQALLSCEATRQPVGQVVSIEVTALDVASSHIRAELYAQRQPRFLLPDQVLTYLNTNGLYVD